MIFIKYKGLSDIFNKETQTCMCLHKRGNMYSNYFPSKNKNSNQLLCYKL